MLNDRLNAYRAVEAQFLPAEEAVEAAFQQLTALVDTMNKARVSAKLSVHTGRPMFAQLTNAIYHLGLARECVLDAHAAGVETRREVLPTVSFGDVTPCPPGPTGEEKHLKIVA